MRVQQLAHIYTIVDFIMVPLTMPISSIKQVLFLLGLIFRFVQSAFVLRVCTTLALVYGCVGNPRSH